jgi:hypothetical protein
MDRFDNGGCACQSMTDFPVHQDACGAAQHPQVAAQHWQSVRQNKRHSVSNISDVRAFVTKTVGGNSKACLRSLGESLFSQTSSIVVMA